MIAPAWARRSGRTRRAGPPRRPNRLRRAQELVDLRADRPLLAGGVLTPGVWVTRAACANVPVVRIAGAGRDTVVARDDLRPDRAGIRGEASHGATVAAGSRSCREAAEVPASERLSPNTYTPENWADASEAAVAAQESSNAGRTRFLVFMDSPRGLWRGWEPFIAAILDEFGVNRPCGRVRLVRMWVAISSIDFVVESRYRIPWRISFSAADTS